MINKSTINNNPWHSSPVINCFPNVWPFFDHISNTKLNINHNYQNIAKDFFEKYSDNSKISIEYLENYYHPQSLITMRIQEGTNDYSYEFIGYNNFKNKFRELKMNNIEYHSMIYTAQPIGTDAILVTIHGRATINYATCSISSTFVIKYFEGCSKIMNHIFNIFP